MRLTDPHEREFHEAYRKIAKMAKLLTPDVNAKAMASFKDLLEMVSDKCTEQGHHGDVHVLTNVMSGTLCQFASAILIFAASRYYSGIASDPSSRRVVPDHVQETIAEAVAKVMHEVGAKAIDVVGPDDIGEDGSVDG